MGQARTGSIQWSSEMTHAPVFLMKALLILLFPIFLVSACTREKDPLSDPKVLKHVVVEYNRLLAEGYKDLNMTPLLQVATDERATKAYYHMSALGEARTRMDAKLDEVSFRDVRIIGENTAEVKTREKWKYTHTNIDTEETAKKESVVYELAYTLVRKENRWLVSDIEIEKEQGM